MKTYQSFSSEETKKLGEKTAKQFGGAGAKAKKSAGALVFALKGELGAGKTTFVQGFFRGLGLMKWAPSPTFIIMRRHALPWRRGRAFSDIFHVDAYRLKKAADLGALDFDDVLGNPKNIVLIEWGDRAKQILPKNAIWLTFRHGKHENERRIMIKR
jgi:tRNA threonylcarbamoyladenosine biosynthesis protein TsaE